MDKTSQQEQVVWFRFFQVTDKTEEGPNVEQPLSPNTRRSFSFSSLRIKKRHHSNEEAGFPRRRGFLSFSSVREASRREPSSDEDGASQLRGTQDQMKKTGILQGTMNMKWTWPI